MTKPDKAGSRAARTAHCSKLLIVWRRRKQLSRAEAAHILCYSAETIGQWERRQALPQGVSHQAIVAFLKGGAR